MTRRLNRRRQRPRPGTRRRRTADEASRPTGRARMADAAARAFGVVVLLGTLAATFGGWIATLR